MNGENMWFALVAILLLSIDRSVREMRKIMQRALLEKEPERK